MNDSIYIVDPLTKEPTRVQAVSFAEINIKERADLEAWVVKNPNLLGERLLVVTAEFARFDRSSRRLDVLALDEDGTLVVIELKLDAGGTLADQQAIRYAAFCSTMTMGQVVEAFVAYHRKSDDEAVQQICDFLATEELPELAAQPRIILAAGQIEDQELTACVIWLRGFGIDITCVELTPYRIPVSGQIVLVPRVIIPLPEARDFIVKVEQRKVAEIHEQQTKFENAALWRAIGEEFNKVSPHLKTAGRSKGNYMQIPVGMPHVHYEWLRKKKDGCIDVAIHFETDDAAVNTAMLAPFEAARAAIEQGVRQPVTIGLFGKKWAQVKFKLPYSGSEPPSEVAPKAAQLMKLLIDRTLTLVQALRAT